jgi:hypothetical protein
MSALTQKIGPYLYAEGYLAELKFAFDRTFTVVISGAFDAGIIGSEFNGIVVLDDDHRAVVLDQHLRASSGYHGPTEAQKAEFERIKGMDWGTFSRFCKGHPRYRGGIGDIDSLSGPDNGDALNRAIASGKPTGKAGRSILLPEMVAANADPECPYKFPHATREDIIVALARHHGHVPMNHNNGGFVVAWDIKVRGDVDFTGTNHGKEEVDPAYDKAWEIFTNKNSDSLFWEACEDGLRQWTEGDYTTWPDGDRGAYKFSTNGRSNGHLILTGWDGPRPPSGGWASCPMAFQSRNDYIEWLKELDEKDLARFYKLVTCCDHDTRNPHEEVSFQIACQRQSQEQAWEGGEPLPAGVEPVAAAVRNAS